MRLQMKKRYLLAGLVLALSSSFVAATGGGGGGGHAATKDLKLVELKASWNGQAGRQQSSINGIMVQWYADACGNRVERRANDGYGWGAPLMTGRMMSGQVAASETCEDKDGARK